MIQCQSIINMGWINPQLNYNRPILISEAEWCLHNHHWYMNPVRVQALLHNMAAIHLISVSFCARSLNKTLFRSAPISDHTELWSWGPDTLNQKGNDGWWSWISQSSHYHMWNIGLTKVSLPIWCQLHNYDGVQNIELLNHHRGVLPQ